MAVKKDFKTPVGELRWMYVSGRGKEGRGKNKGTFRFVGSLYLQTASTECNALKDKIKAFWNENKPRKGRHGSLGFKDEMVVDDDYVPILDKDGKEQYTGETSFDFWTGTTWKDGKPKVVDIYSAGNKKEGIISTKISLHGKTIGNGSIGAIAGSMGIFDQDSNMGISLYLNAVQLHKLVEYCKDPGFEDSDEGGYEEEEEEEIVESGTCFGPEEESVAKEEAKPRI